MDVLLMKLNDENDVNDEKYKYIFDKNISK